MSHRNPVYKSSNLFVLQAELVVSLIQSQAQSYSKHNLNRYYDSEEPATACYCHSYTIALCAHAAHWNESGIEPPYNLTL